MNNKNEKMSNHMIVYITDNSKKDQMYENCTKKDILIKEKIKNNANIINNNKDGNYVHRSKKEHKNNANDNI